MFILIFKIVVNLLVLIILGSSISLFYFNFRKEKKIFLGDGGSLFLGGIIAILLITTNRYNVYDLDLLTVIVVCYFYPMFDIFRIVILRLRNKKSPFIADKLHIHHEVLKKAKIHATTTFIIISICITLQFVILLISTGR